MNGSDSRPITPPQVPEVLPPNVKVSSQIAKTFFTSEISVPYNINIWSAELKYTNTFAKS